MSKRAIKPPRPYIPPLVYALIVSIMLSRLCLLYLIPKPWMFYLASGAFILTTGIAFKTKALQHKLLFGSTIIILVALACFLSAGYKKELMLATAAYLETKPISNVELVLENDSTTTDSGYRSIAKVYRDKKSMARVWLVSREPFYAGSKIKAVGRYKPNGDDEFSKANSAQAIVGTVSVVHILELDEATGLQSIFSILKEKLLVRIGATSSDGRSLLAGIALGDRAALKSRGVNDVFTEAGVAHLVAVSGSHIALFSALILSLLRSVHAKLRVRIVVVLVASAGFVVLCGIPISAIRAWCMVAITYVAELLGRRSHALSALSIVALLMLIINPDVAGQISYLLSVSSVLGLNIFAAYFTYVCKVLLPFPALLRKLPKRIWRILQKLWYASLDGIATSCVAQLFTISIVSASFGQISLVAILSNLCVSNLFALALSTGIIAVALSYIPYLGSFLLALNDSFTNACIIILRLISSIPFATIPVDLPFALSFGISFICASLILVLWPNVSRKAIALCIAGASLIWTGFFIKWRYFAPARFVVLNVGQGDALLVQEGAHAILIDTGPDKSIVTELQALHVFHIDSLVITHYHDDHMAALADLTKHVSIDSLCVAKGSKPNMPEETALAVAKSFGEAIYEIEKGDTLICENFSLYCLWPQDEVSGLKNEHSIQLRLAYNDAQQNEWMSILLTGDGEQDVMEHLLEEDKLLPLDVLKLGHHGSKISLTQEQADKLQIDLAVASAGVNNSFGHPAKSLVGMLEAAGIQVLSTNQVGRILLYPNEQGILVEHKGSV